MDFVASSEHDSLATSHWLVGSVTRRCVTRDVAASIEFGGGTGTGSCLSSLVKKSQFHDSNIAAFSLHAGRFRLVGEVIGLQRAARKVGIVTGGDENSSMVSSDIVPADSPGVVEVNGVDNVVNVTVKSAMLDGVADPSKVFSIGSGMVRQPRQFLELMARCVLNGGQKAQVELCVGLCEQLEILRSVAHSLCRVVPGAYQASRTEYVRVLLWFRSALRYRVDMVAVLVPTIQADPEGGQSDRFCRVLFELLLSPAVYRDWWALADEWVSASTANDGDAAATAADAGGGGGGDVDVGSVKQETEDLLLFDVLLDVVRCLETKGNKCHRDLLAGVPLLPKDLLRRLDCMFPGPMQAVAPMRLPDIEGSAVGQTIPLDPWTTVEQVPDSSTVISLLLDAKRVDRGQTIAERARKRTKLDSNFDS